MTANDKQIVKTPSVFKVDSSFNDERFMRVRIAVMHSGINLNKSSFETKVIKEAKDTFADIPVLANIIKYVDENGEEHYDYGGHDAHIEEDAFNEGQYRVIYDEKVVGHVPTVNNFEIVHDDESGNDFVYVDAYLYREYGNYACDILEARGGTTSVSAEVYTDEISFDAENQVVVVNKMRMSGITLLGDEVKPAMKGANATTFSMNEEDLHTQMIKVMSELKDSLDKYNAAFNGENSEKGGNRSVKFEELLEKYNKTVEEIDFEYDGLTDEELEALFAEHFAEPENPEAADPVVDEAFEQEEDEEHEAEDDEDLEEEDEDSKEDESAPEEEENFAKMSITMNGVVKEFSVSLKDKLNALYELVNTTYEDDGTWYDVDVYDDEKYVIMVDCFTGRGYKQSYKVKKDVYTLVGDRVEVYAKWLTEDEINKLDKMKADYAVMEEKLSHYEEEPKKLEILNSDDYSLIAENEEFVALKKQDNHFNMSVEELTAKADAILTAAAKQHKFSVADNHDDQNGVKPFAAPKKKSKRFGTLFDGII